jgi:hypothetical protein
LFKASIDEDEQSLSHKLKREYGSGQYLSQARNEDGQVVASMKLIVPEPAAAAPVAASTGLDGLGGMLARMQMMQAKAQQDFQANMMQFQQQQAAQQADLFKSLIVPLVTGRGGGEGLGLKEVIPLLKSANNPIQDMKALWELQSAMKGDAPDQGDGNSDSDWLGLAKAFAPAINGVLAEPAAPAARAAPAPTLPNRPAPQPANQPAKNAEQLLNEHLQRTLLTCIRAAKRGQEPTLYADFLIAELGDLAEFEPLMRDAAGIQKLAMLQPAIQPHSEWFERLRVAVVEYLDLPEDPEEPVPAA